MKQKIIYFLKNTLLINMTVFLILAPFSKKLVKISLLVALGFWLLLVIVEFGSNFHRHLIVKISIKKPLIFFGLAIFLSTIFSLEPYYSHAVLLERFLGYILFFFIGNYLVRYKRNLDILIGGIILAGIFMGVGGMWDHFHLRSPRLFTSFGHIISLSDFMTLYIPFCFIIVLFSKTKILKAGSVICSIFLFPCLLLNATRAAWVAVAGSLLIVSFFKNRKIAFCLLIVFIISGFFLPLALQQRAMTTVNPLTWGERLPLWKISLEIFADFPVFGAGLGMYEKLLAQYWEPSSLSPQLPHWNTHNNYLQVVSESGIVGLIAFTWIFIAFFKHAFAVLNKTSGEQQVILMGLTGSVIAALIFAMSASNITSGVQEVAVFWFMFGMAFGLISIVENKEVLS